MDVTTLLSDISGVVHGTTINKIPNVYGIINRAARAVLLDVDPKETQRIVQIAQVFNSVYDYTLPSDVKGDRIIDLRIQKERMPNDIFTHNYAQTFDSQKLISTSNRVNIQHNTGVKTIRIEAPLLSAPETISNTGSITGWTNITPTLDATNNIAGSGALVFNLPAQVNDFIENSTITALDLSTHLNLSTIFVWVYLPSGSAISSVNLKWGSSNANYYQKTVTTNQEGTVFHNGWNLLAFEWNTSTTNGTPDSTIISYLKLTFNYNAVVQTGVKICNFTSVIGYNFELQYYSKYLFRDPTTNAFQETVVDTTDNSKIINLDTESYNLLFNKMAFFVAQTLQGADADYDATYWGEEYANALAKYKALNPNEVIKKSETYYKTPNKSYTKYAPTIWRH